MRPAIIAGLLLGIVAASGTPRVVKRRTCSRRSTSSSLPQSSVASISSSTYTSATETASTIESLTSSKTIPSSSETALTSSETIPSSTETTPASSETLLSSTSATDPTRSSITEPETTTTTVTSLSSSETPITTTTPPSATSTATSTVTTTSTTTAPSAPIITNGDFETGNREGWTFSQLGGGSGTVVLRGDSYVLDLYTSYFINYTPAQAVVKTEFNCVAGARYRLSIDVSVVSSYTNGNPWSILVGTTSIASGPGSSLTQRTVTYDFNCVGNTAADFISVRMQSNTSRQGHLYIDNVIVTPLGVGS